MHHIRARRALGALALTIAAGGTLAAQAGAHARIYPDSVREGAGNAYTLVVPNESETASTNEITITVPEGVLIGGFEAKDGWKRVAVSEGEGHSAVTSKVTWSGGEIPPGEAGWFRFTARPDEEHTPAPTEYTFAVEQTYDDGTVANWAGAEDSEEPAPVVAITAADTGAAAAAPAASTDEDADDDDDGGSMGTIALIVAIVALLLGLAGLFRRGGRALT